MELQKALDSWLADVSVTSKPSDEPGIFLNKIIFTHKNGNVLDLVLFDVNELDSESLDGEYYRGAEETFADMAEGFPRVNCIMYSVAAAAISKKIGE